jgi:hypothetical protein
MKTICIAQSVFIVVYIDNKLRIICNVIVNICDTFENAVLNKYFANNSVK